MTSLEYLTDVIDNLKGCEENNIPVNPIDFIKDLQRIKYIHEQELNPSPYTQKHIHK